MKALLPFLDALFPPRVSELLVRTSEQDAVCALLSPTEHQESGIEVVGLLPYRTPLVAALVLEAKFRSNRKAQDLLGAVLAEYLMEYQSEEAALSGTEYTLIPVPLATERLRSRGYNQVERICQSAAKRLSVSVESSLLKRGRHTTPQTKLSREERLQNVVGAFQATSVNPSASYVVVDDVTTTGATLQAAVEALRAAGALHVQAIALAHQA